MSVVQRAGVQRPIEVRAKTESQSAGVKGYASVFYDGSSETEYWLWDDMVERIMPGAFDTALKADDVRCLVNHNPDKLLGRTAAGTLALRVDKVGLHYECDVPDTQFGRDAIISCERKDMTGSSFSFVPTKRTWREEKEKDSNRTIYIREIEEVQLWDVGPVTFPAYEGATAGVRCGRQRRSIAEKRYRELMEERSQAPAVLQERAAIDAAAVEHRIMTMRSDEIRIAD